MVRRAALEREGKLEPTQQSDWNRQQSAQTLEPKASWTSTFACSQRTQDAAPAHWNGLAELTPMLRTYLRALTRSSGEVDDLLGEVLARAASSRLRLGSPQNLRGWALTVAANVWRDHVRRSIRRQRLFRAEEDLETVEGREPAPQDLDFESIHWGEDWRSADLRQGGMPHSPAQLREAFDASFATLRAGDRSLLASFYRHNRQTLSVAEECGIPRHRIKVRVFRARQRLLGEIDSRLAAASLIASTADSKVAPVAVPRAGAARAAQIATSSQVQEPVS